MYTTWKIVVEEKLGVMMAYDEQGTKREFVGVTIQEAFSFMLKSVCSEKEETTVHHIVPSTFRISGFDYLIIVGPIVHPVIEKGISEAFAVVFSSPTSTTSPAAEVPEGHAVNLPPEDLMKLDSPGLDRSVDKS